MDHSNHTPLPSHEMTDAILASAPVHDREGHKIGTISHLHGTGTAAEMVIDVGGFLGIGTKPVLISTGQVQMMRDEAGRVHGVTSWTREQLKDLPEHRD